MSRIFSIMPIFVCFSISCSHESSCKNGEARTLDRLHRIEVLLNEIGGRDLHEIGQLHAEIDRNSRLVSMLMKIASEGDAFDKSSLQDSWHRNFKFRYTNNSIIIWSLGCNAIDDNGDGDDISLTIEIHNIQFSRPFSGQLKSPTCYPPK